MKKKLLLSLLAIVAIFGCDNATKDTEPVLQVNYVTGPNLPLIFKPSAFVENSVSKVDFKTAPLYGSVQTVTDKKFLTYSPGQDFNAGEDHFTVDVLDSDGVGHPLDVLIEVNNNSCDYGPVFEFIQVKKGESVSINLLENDFFCGGPSDVTSGGITHYLVNSEFENNDFFDIHFHTPNDDVSIKIDAPNETGVVEFIYEVGIGIKPEFVLNHAAHQLPDGTLNPYVFERFLISKAIIEIID